MLLNWASLMQHVDKNPVPENYFQDEKKNSEIYFFR